MKLTKPLYLYLAENNFYYIKSVNSLLEGDGRFCPVCHCFVTGKTSRHICDAKVCRLCKTVRRSPKFSSGFISVICVFNCSILKRVLKSSCCGQVSHGFCQSLCLREIAFLRSLWVDLLMKNGVVLREAYTNIHQGNMKVLSRNVFVVGSMWIHKPIYIF